MAELLAVLALIAGFLAWQRTRTLSTELETLRDQLREAGRVRPAASAAPADPTAAAGATPAREAAEPPRPGVQQAAEPELEASASRAAAAPPRGTAAAEAPGAGPRRRARPRLPASLDLERMLGARLPVWLGASALLLAVAYLVKFSFDRDLVSAPARVGLGLASGAGLVVAGEVLRSRAPGIVQGLSAAGVGALYASLLAGVELYDLIAPAPGFLLLAATTGLAVALSLRHGPVVALVGLVGGFATPALVSVEEPNAPALFAYLFLLEIGILSVSARRGWWRMASLALVGMTVWACLWLVDPFELQVRLSLGAFLLGSAGAFAVAAERAGAAGETAAARPWRILAGAAGALAAVLMGGLTAFAGFGSFEWAYVGLLGAGTLAVARRTGWAWPLAVLTAGVSALLLAAWGSAPQMPTFGRLLGTGAWLGAVHAGGAFLLHRGAARPARFTGLSAGAAVAFTWALWWAAEAPPRGVLGGVALGLAALYAGALRRALHRGLGREVAGTLGVGAAALAALALPMELERAWIGVGWAALVAAIAAVDARLDLRPLRTLAAWLAAAVGVRLLLNPFVFDYPTGELPVLNWLLYGYGLPAACALVASERFRRSGARRLAHGLALGGVALGGALFVLQVRHAFHGSLGGGSVHLGEWGAIATLAFLYGAALLRANARWPRRAWPQGAQAAVAVGLAVALVGLGLRTPLWASHLVGETPVWNLLLFAYGAPVPAALLAARGLGARGEGRLAAATSAAALALVFALVTLEVRQAFHGTDLRTGPTTAAEIHAYSAAWALLGTALLVVGIATRGTVVRWASLAVMLLAVGKVFLYDTSELRDLYRVVSLLGLGLSLLALAWLYQRFIFAGRAPDGDEATEPGDRREGPLGP